MVVGNLVSGRLSDKYTPGKVGDGGAGHDLHCAVDAVFPVAQSVVLRHIDGSLYGGAVCGVEPRTGIDYPRSSRRGDAGRRCVQMAFNLAMPSEHT